MKKQNQGGKKKTPNRRNLKLGEMQLCRSKCEKEFSSPDARGTSMSQLEDVGANSCREGLDRAEHPGKERCGLPLH